MLRSSLLCDTVQLAIDDQLLILNSAADPFVAEAAQRVVTGEILLAEDNIAALHTAQTALDRENQGRRPIQWRHVPFHEYTLHEAPATIDVAVMNMLFQPGNAWMHYALEIAAYALKPGGRLYVQGAKDRGVLSLAKRMQALFGNVETLEIHKGDRVVRSTVGAQFIAPNSSDELQGAIILDNQLANALRASAAHSGKLQGSNRAPTLFAEGKLDEGTRLLLESLEVRVTDVALDMGCGAGFIGCHMARLATKGQVTMVDASLVAVEEARRRVEQSGLTNAQVLSSDGAQAVSSQRFDLVVTNPPFHIGGIQTTEIGERFIREVAQVLRPRGRFYLVANRFLKYEPTMRECFKVVEEVGGNTRFKVLRGAYFGRD
ncbi:MAG: methyltransferase [Chloroflexi bacterium]|nr:MAG: methyltransferase [Chloroflexota bacterium]